MPIRTGRLYKICERCEKKFLPEGKKPRICNDCYEEKHKRRRKKLKIETPQDAWKILVREDKTLKTKK